ncbi:hypothetical protein ONO23_05442 [Micromonospora noduli]|nr:hypothetical protein ONO23_05442 [Micromonospora noduli]
MFGSMPRCGSARRWRRRCWSNWATALVMRHYRTTGDWRHGDGGTIGEPLAGVDRLGACVEEPS